MVENSPTADPEKSPKIPRILIILGYTWSFLFLPLVWIDTRGNAQSNAIIGMALGLMILWMGIGAILQRVVVHKLQRINTNILLNFTIYATGMALTEEAIATTMTNLATPIWGVSPHEAYITASINYLEVVLLNSVVVFVPMFIYWGFILKNYKFHQLWIYVLFGISGTLAETLSFGPSNLINIGFWMNIYGLMVYIPASLIDDDYRKQPPRWLYVMSIILPLICAIPVVLLVLFIRLILGI